MGFNDLIQKTSALSIARFKNCTVVAKLGFAEMGSFPGIFIQHTEVVSPWESERAVVKPSVTVDSSALEGIDSSYTLEIRMLNPPEEIGKNYKLDGKPQPDGTGLTVVYLGASK